MEKYFYTKNIDPEVLDEAIKLRTSLRSVYLSCFVNENEDGSVEDDNIEVRFTRALTSYEQDEITNLVNLVGPTYDLMIRKSIERNTMAWAMEKGKVVLAQFAANNLARGKSAQQVEALVTDYPDIIHSLLTGSLQTSYIIFSNMTADANISQEEIDEFKLRLAIILGV